MSTTRQRITRRQRVYEYICTYTDEHGRPPTYREIKDACGYRSMAGVQFQLKKLEAAGLIVRDPFTARGIMIASDAVKADVHLLDAAREVVRCWDEGGLGPAIRRLAVSVGKYDGTR